MSPGFFRNLSYSAFQLFFNQVLAFIFFIILSKYLTKADFGLLNWSLAVLLIVFSVLSFGFDQLLVKKIASGENISSLVSVYFFHACLSGLLFYLALFFIFFFFAGDSSTFLSMMILAIGKFFISLSLPFKSLASGKEKFKWLFYMSLPANLIKAVGVILLFFLHRLNLANTLIVFVTGDLTEFLVSSITASRFFSFRHFLRFEWKQYVHLFNESLPQFGVVLFAIALSKFDHVLLGFMSTSSALAEYSFAYRIFELSSFPLLIIGPLLLPMVSRFMSKGMETRMSRIHFLLRMEMVLSCFTILFLNIAWTSVVEPLTSGKYGKTNEVTILFLSLSLPFLYLNNVLWTMDFARGKLKMILGVFAITFFINLVGDLLLIPLYAGKGAALAYFLSIAVQSFLYIRQTDFKGLNSILKTLSTGFLASLFIVLASRTVHFNVILLILAGSILFILVLIFSGQLKKTDWIFLKQLKDPRTIV